MSLSVPNQYPIHLTGEERDRFEQITRNGHAPAKKIRHAQILLLSDRQRADGHYTAKQIADLLGICEKTVDRTRRRFVLEGESPTLNRKKRETPPNDPILDGEAEAYLVATCCSPPPAGRVRWTLKLLANTLVERGIVTSICAETVRRTLKKTNCNPGANAAGVSPSGTRRVS